MMWIMTFAICLGSSIVPGVGSELYLIALAATVDVRGAVLLALVSALAQVVGKIVVYGAAATGGRATGFSPRGCAAMLTARLGRRVPEEPGQDNARLVRRLQQRGLAANAIIFCSAAASVPPLYVVSIACGLCRFGLLRFAAPAFAGRTLRSLMMVGLPQLLLEVAR